MVHELKTAALTRCQAYSTAELLKHREERDDLQKAVADGNAVYVMLLDQIAKNNNDARARIGRLREALLQNRQGMENILEVRKIAGSDRYGNLTREEVEGVIAGIDAALKESPNA